MRSMLTLLIFVSLAPAAFGSDGRIELNQVCATQTGCAPGDAPGFPITLTARGSYLLTSGLAVPNENTNGIEVSDADIHIDLNGFALLGPGTVPIATHVCTLPGTGSGVVVTGTASGLVVQNGNVRGMGKDGINASTQNARVERVIAERNCGAGITVGITGLVVDSQVRANAGDGIVTNNGSRVRDAVADQNGRSGVLAGSGSVVTGCVATANGLSGIAMQDFNLLGGMGGVVMGNSSVGNGATIAVGGISVPNGGVAIYNSAALNQGTGITGGTTSGFGLNASASNGGAEFFGGVTIGCNVADGVKTCP